MAKANRQKDYLLTLKVGKRQTGIWDKQTGGGVDSEDEKYQPGGGQPKIALGGEQEIDNITLQRYYDLDRDHTDLIKYLLNAVGGTRIVYVKQPLNAEGVPFGDPLVYNGVLKKCDPPEVDSESSSAGMLSIELSLDGDIA